jgi:hypothetical protein
MVLNLFEAIFMTHQTYATLTVWSFTCCSTQKGSSKWQNWAWQAMPSLSNGMRNLEPKANLSDAGNKALPQHAYFD